MTAWSLAALLVVAPLFATARPLAAQYAATVAPSDPAYADVARLEALGLMPRGSGGSGPWSVGRIAWMVREARALAAARDLPPPVRDDVTAILARLARRFPPEDARTATGAVEAEVGGGRSPGRFTPNNGLGSLDAVVNPLWMGNNGRAYGDRSTAAAAARVALPLGSAVAIMAGGRVSTTSSTGEPLRGDGPTVETLALRVRLGSLALEAGRDYTWVGDGSSRELALSGNGPPLDLIRLGTDRPLSAFFLGDVDFSLFVLDMGETQVPAHAKLFGVLITSRPTPAVELGLTLLNKQLGEGAPDASVGDRIKDLTWVADWFSPGVAEFSDKIAGVSVRLRPAGGAVSLLAEGVLTDFDHHRPRHTFMGTAGYRLTLELPRLGASGRHAVRAEGSWIGPVVYLHHQFTSGHAAGGFPMGSHLGADSHSVRVSYGYHPAARDWWAEMGISVDDWRGDTWRPGDEGEDQPQRVEDGTDEIRLRGDLSLHKGLLAGRAGVDLTLGLERVRSFAFQAGDDRLNGAARLRFWHAF